MILRAVNRINLYARTFRLTANCKFVFRCCPVSVASVNGAAVLQADSVESCCRQTGSRGYHNTSSRTDRLSYRTSRIALAAAVVIALGSAGK